MELNYNEAILLTEIATIAVENKGICCAPDSLLLEAVGLSERTYYRTLKSLECKNVIKRETKSVGHYGKERKIIINIPKYLETLQYYT
jgi:hypothetical protein